MVGVDVEVDIVGVVRVEGVGWCERSRWGGFCNGLGGIGWVEIDG